MKIAVGCDHGGFEHKNAIVEHLKAEGFEVEDFGIYENKSVDYPEIALKVANSIKNGENELGILICGTEGERYTRRRLQRAFLGKIHQTSQ